MTHDGTGTKSEAGRYRKRMRRFNQLKSKTRENGKTAGGDTERRNRRKAGRDI